MKKIYLTLIVLTLNGSIIISQSDGCDQNSKLIDYFLTAISQGNLEKMETYIESGININGSFCDNPLTYGGTETPFIFHAIRTGRYDVVKFFIDKGANVNSSYTVKGGVAINPVTMESRNYSALTYYPLNECLSQRKMKGNIDINIIKLLIDKGAMREFANDDARGTNNSNIIKLFNDNGIVSNYSSSDLLKALETGNNETFNYLINGGVKGDCECLKAVSGMFTINYDRIKLFLNQGVNINCTSANYRHYRLSPLGWAVYQGNLDLVKFLVENGADLSARCIWRNSGDLGNVDKNQSLAEFSDAQFRNGIRNSNVTEYLVLSPGIQRKKMKEKEQKINEFRKSAQYQLSIGNTSQADVFYQKAYELSRNEEDSNGLLYHFRSRGRYYLNTRHKPDSAKYYFELAYNKGKLPIDLQMYGLSLLELKKFQDALTVFLDYQKKYSDNSSIVGYIGECYMRLNDFKNAKSYLLISYDNSSSENKKAAYNLACYYSEVGEMESSLKYMKIAFERGFKDFKLIDNEEFLNDLRKSKDGEKLINKYKKKYS